MEKSVWLIVGSDVNGNLQVPWTCLNETREKAIEELTYIANDRKTLKFDISLNEKDGFLLVTDRKTNDLIETYHIYNRTIDIND